MKLRRVAISVAATTALVLGAAAAPALADHVDEDPLLVDEGRGGNVTCEELGLVKLFDKVDPPVEVDNDFVTTTLSDPDNGKFRKLDVVAKEGFVITAVIVKGGPASYVYFHEPFTGLTSPEFPDGHPQAGKIPAISHYEVCGEEDDGEEKEKKKKKKKKRDRDRDKDKTPPPPDDEDENGDDDKNGKDEEDEDEKKPVAVPTAVPAGHGDTGSGVTGTVGLIAALAALTAAAAAGAMLIRRRFGHES